MTLIGVKGDRDGLIISLPDDGSNEEVFEALRAHLEQAGAFFKGAAVTLDTGGRSISAEELEQVRDVLGGWEVQLEAIRSDVEATRSAALAVGLELPFFVQPETAADREQRSVAVPEESIDALLVRRTLRSGQVVRHPGSVVVLGDLNPGAEVIAGGDIVVWGSLRGVVHAGAIGDDGAVVCALKLSPTQLRISDQIAVAPEEKERRQVRLWKRLNQQRPERARLHEGKIIVEPWPEQR